MIRTQQDCCDSFQVSRWTRKARNNSRTNEFRGGWFDDLDTRMLKEQECLKVIKREKSGLLVSMSSAEQRRGGSFSQFIILIIL